MNGSRSIWMSVALAGVVGCTAAQPPAVEVEAGVVTVDGGQLVGTELVQPLALQDPAAPEPYPYYRCWQRALEALLVERGLCSEGELDGLAQRLAARPHGHDHA